MQRDQIVQIVKEYPWKGTYESDPTLLDMVVDDVVAIVNGRKYPSRGLTQELRYPEDISTVIAMEIGYDAYSGYTEASLLPTYYKVGLLDDPSRRIF